MPMKLMKYRINLLKLREIEAIKWITSFILAIYYKSNNNDQKKLISILLYRAFTYILDIKVCFLINDLNFTCFYSDTMPVNFYFNNTSKL